MSEPDSIQQRMDTSGAASPGASSDGVTPREQGGRPVTQCPETAINLNMLNPGAAPSLAEMPADQVGRYSVFGEIGRGGMGVVLRGRDPELGRDLALKVM